MSDIKLFRTASGSVSELEGRSVEIEKSLPRRLGQLIAVTLEADLHTLSPEAGLSPWVILARIEAMTGSQENWQQA